MNANRLDTSPISLDAVGLNGTAMDIFREVTSMTWRLKSSIRGQIESIQQHLALPETYGAIHIRSGDKIKEAKRLQTTADVEGIFVLTDDYNNFRQLVQDYPQLSFYTLEREHQTGYHHRINKRRSRNEKQLDYLNFLASIEIAAAAKTYVGTFSSNVSTFLRIRMDEHKCHAVDR
jgi:hypothetical protein